MDNSRPADPAERGPDEALLLAVRTRLAAQALTAGARALSLAGEHGALWIAGGLLAFLVAGLLLRKGRKLELPA